MKLTTSSDVIIIGAGAAGLMCAIEAAKRGRRVVVLEKSKKAGRKILISGGGRCNFTNLYIEPNAFISKNPHFCKSALARFTQWDFIAMMDEHQLDWHEKTLGQLFCDAKAPAVVEMLLSQCAEYGVQIELNCAIGKISFEGGYTVESGEQQFTAASLVIATGGPSIPGMGATDFGIRIAQQFGIQVVEFTPALVPFTFSSYDKNLYFKGLSGISIECIVSCNGASFRENLLITHRGLSGPACLQVSTYWRQGDPISINLLPDLDATEWLLVHKKARGKAALKTILGEHLPKRLAVRLADTLLEPALSNIALDQISHQVLADLGQQLNQWVLTPSGTEGMRTAEVSLGGVNTDALSSKTMQALDAPGLHFIGETVDVTGWLGGYNFQWAWSSGWVAGQYV